MRLNLMITPQAALFYRREMALSPGQGIRLFVRIGGYGCGGYSVGVQPALPTARDMRLEVEGVPFLVREEDLWYLNGLRIEYDAQYGITFRNPLWHDPLHPHAIRSSVSMTI